MGRFHLILSLVFGLLTAVPACSQNSAAENQDVVFVASTPGDLVKPLLNIPADKEIDFIKWDLRLLPGNKFSLDLKYGLGKPNTTGFIGGGEERSFRGDYRIEKNGHPVREVLRLRSTGFQRDISLGKLTDNVYHLLSPDQQFLVGTGGWSYTINRKDPVAEKGILPASVGDSPVVNDTSSVLVFDGRTPCMEIAKEYGFPVISDCFKLKWRLVLKRDPATLQPAGYVIYRTDNRRAEIKGEWIILRKNTPSGEAIIYQLDPGQPEKSISFLQGDKNVLFVLDKSQRLYTGNELFSYTLNRVK